jgi:hypothetical protein
VRVFVLTTTNLELPPMHDVLQLTEQTCAERSTNMPNPLLVCRLFLYRNVFGQTQDLPLLAVGSAFVIIGIVGFILRSVFTHTRSPAPASMLFSPNGSSVTQFRSPPSPPAYVQCVCAGPCSLGGGTS